MPTSFPVVIDGESMNATGVPSAIAAELDSIWVSDTRNGVVYRLDPQTCRTLATIPIGGHSPEGHGGIAELDGSIWVTSPGTNAIVRIDPDTNTVIGSIPVPYPPSGLVAADGSLWVTLNPNMSSDEETPRSPFRGSTCG